MGPGNEARLNVRSMTSIGIVCWYVSPVWYMWAPLHQCCYHPAKGQQALVDVACLPGTFVYGTGATNVLTSCKIHLHSHAHTASTACLKHTCTHMYTPNVPFFIISRTSPDYCLIFILCMKFSEKLPFFVTYVRCFTKMGCRVWHASCCGLGCITSVNVLGTARMTNLL